MKLLLSMLKNDAEYVINNKQSLGKKPNNLDF